jgi:hypothetical protein
MMMQHRSVSLKHVDLWAPRRAARMDQLLNRTLDRSAVRDYLVGPPLAQQGWTPGA